MIKYVSESIKNILEKRTKCWLPAFSPFFNNVFKIVLFRVAKSEGFVVKD